MSLSLRGTCRTGPESGGTRTCPGSTEGWGVCGALKNRPGRRGALHPPLWWRSSSYRCSVCCSERRERERGRRSAGLRQAAREQPDGFLLALAISGPCALGRGVRRSRRRSPIARLPRGRAAGRQTDSHDLLLALAISGPCAFAGGRWRSVVPVLTNRQTAAFGNDPSAGSPTETLLRLLLPLDSQV